MSMRSVLCLAAAAMFCTAAGPDGFEYVGTKACKKCHFPEPHKSWSLSKMGRTFHVLKPDADLKPSKKTGLTAEFIAEIKASKAQADLDPTKDYTQDPACLKCHTTGYGQPGGYAIPAAKDRKAKRKAAALEGVGCEACHGPGSGYLKLFEEIQKEERQYTLEELYAVGLKKVDAKTCTACHTKAGNPTAGDDYTFDFDKQRDEDRHKQVEMKLRKG